MMRIRSKSRLLLLAQIDLAPCSREDTENLTNFRRYKMYKVVSSSLPKLKPSQVSLDNSERFSVPNEEKKKIKLCSFVTYIIGM